MEGREEHGVGGEVRRRRRGKKVRKGRKGEERRMERKGERLGVEEEDGDERRGGG